MRSSRTVPAPISIKIILTIRKISHNTNGKLSSGSPLHTHKVIEITNKEQLSSYIISLVNNTTQKGYNIHTLLHYVTAI